MPDKDGKGPKGQGLKDGHGEGKSPKSQGPRDGRGGGKGKESGTNEPSDTKKGGKKGGC